MKHYFDFLQNGREVRDMLRANPTLPVVVLAGDDANNGDNSFQYCSKVWCSIGEVLDCETPFGDEVFTDRDVFREALTDNLADLPEPEFTKTFEQEWAKYEPYWTQVIEIWVDNK